MEICWGSDKDGVTSGGKVWYVSSPVPCIYELRGEAVLTNHRLDNTTETGASGCEYPSLRRSPLRRRGRLTPEKQIQEIDLLAQLATQHSDPTLMSFNNQNLSAPLPSLWPFDPMSGMGGIGSGTGSGLTSVMGGNLNLDFTTTTHQGQQMLMGQMPQQQQQQQQDSGMSGV